MSFMDWCTSDLSIEHGAGLMSFTDYFGRPWKTSRWRWKRWVSSGGHAVVHSLPCCAMDGAVPCWLPGGVSRIEGVGVAAALARKFNMEPQKRYK